MRPIVVTVSSQTTSATLPVNWRGNSFKIGLQIVLSGGAVLTYKIESTMDDVQDPSITPTFIDHDFLTAQTATANGNIIIPVRAVRLNVTAHTSGTATLTILQSN